MSRTSVHVQPLGRLPWWAVAAACLVVGGACERTSRSTERTEMHMGTLVSVRIDGPSQPEAHALVDAAFAAIGAVDARFSNYKPDSELSQLNRSAWEDAQPVSGEMAFLLSEAIDWGVRTDGAFDCTVGPLVRAWGFFKREGRIPAAAELATAQNLSGWPHLTFDGEARTLRFDREGVELDFGAIAKGYAVDRACGVLRERGVTAALIDAGGNFYGIGAPEHRESWRIGIRHPLRRDAILADMPLRDAGIATSGGYENYFEAEGKRYVHIFDPRTGYPVEGMLSASVIAPTATAADALSTATFVLGVEKSLALIAALPDTECLLVSGRPNDPASLQVHMSEGLRGSVHLHLEDGD